MSNPMQRAIDLATQSAEGDGGPFGAVVVFPDGTWVEGTNGVTKLSDPTAHAEVTAIREAARLISSHDLSGAILFSSCQPCPMCLTAALWARLDRIVYAASADEAAAAGFDDRTFYEQLSGGLQTVTSSLVVEQQLATRNDPFIAWQDNQDRVRY